MEKTGVLGLGLMGTSIVACLLAAGHRVAAIDTDAESRRAARRRARALLQGMRAEGLLTDDPAEVVKRLEIGGDYALLAGCDVVIESITEDLEAKRQALRAVESVVAPQAIIGSNTSAIPVTDLQQGAAHPARILGMHWAEPAHLTRFMEIICGAETAMEYADRAVALARAWGKEPTLVRRDVRGFIANRLMYALFREAFHLVEAGYATIADVDRCARNDLGWWITFAGPFRFMDLTGIPAYATVMRELLPDLSCQQETPALLRETVEAGARGVANARGFYEYTPEEAEQWRARFEQFSYEIRALALKYPDAPAN